MKIDFVKTHKVESITRKSSKWVLVTTDGESRTYDSVILAAPFHSAGITVTPPPRFPIPEQPYVHLHVTLLSTSSPTPNPAYFTLPNDTVSPTTVLTTNDGFANGGPAPEFNSLTYHGKTAGHNGRPDEYLVKIFSSEAVDDGWLRSAFGKVGWVHRKEVSDHRMFLLFLFFVNQHLRSGMPIRNSRQPMRSLLLNQTKTCTMSTLSNRRFSQMAGTGIIDSHFVRFISTMETETVRSSHSISFINPPDNAIFSDIFLECRPPTAYRLLGCKCDRLSGDGECYSCFGWYNHERLGLLIKHDIPGCGGGDQPLPCATIQWIGLR